MERVDDILEFWFGAGRSARAWFTPDPAFDRACTAGFLADHERAAAGALDGWQAAPRSALALILLLDQFPRNMFRGTARAFASDARALGVAGHAIACAFDASLRPVERVFVYLPFEHSENLDDQRESVRLLRRLATAAPETAGYLEYAEQHLHIIRCFGRFPHRNAVLGRLSTAAETAYLASGVLPGGAAGR